MATLEKSGSVTFSVGRLPFLVVVGDIKQTQHILVMVPVELWARGGAVWSSCGQPRNEVVHGLSTRPHRRSLAEGLVHKSIGIVWRISP